METKIKPLVECLIYSEDNGRYLALKRAKPPIVWSTVTGGVEPGETFWQAALRELQEETGTRPDRFYNGDFSHIFYRHDPERVYGIFVFLALYTQAPKIMLNHEHEDYEWLDKHALLARIPFSGQRRGIKHVHREFIKKPPTEILRIAI